MNRSEYRKDCNFTAYLRIFNAEIQYQVAKNRLQSFLWKTWDKPAQSEVATYENTCRLASSRLSDNETEELEQAIEKFDKNCFFNINDARDMEKARLISNEKGI